MRAQLFVTALIFSLGANSLSATPCAREVTPAATLLLPYFETHLSNLAAHNTTATIHNISSSPVLVKAEIFTDMGIAVGGFNFFLPARGRQVLSLRDVIACNLPSTPAPASYGSCAGAIPLPAALCAGYDLPNSLIGKPSSFFGGLCAGRNLGDIVARGYMTFDTVRFCSLAFQGSPDYFLTGGAGIATNENVLTGDFQISTSATARPFSAPLVHIEARTTTTELTNPGQFTFYGAWNGWSAADNREPLGNIHAPRFQNDASVRTDLLVWRDPERIISPFSCGTTPVPFPLTAGFLFAYDGLGSSTTIGGTPFPVVAQRVRVGSSALPTSYTAGWFRLGLNTTTAGAPAEPNRSQGWIGAQLVSATAALNASFEVPQIDNSCTGILAYP